MIDNKFIIDAHCHIYPEKIAEKAVAGTDRFYDVTSQCIGTCSELIKNGDAAGVDRFIVQSVATTARQVPSINEFIAKSVEESGGRFVGLGTLYPGSDCLEEDYNHLVSLGLRGVKLHPDIQDFKLDDYRCLKIYELCERDGLPLLLHTGDKRYDNSNPNRLIPILEIFTGLKVVGAHFGGWSIYEQAAEQLRGFENLWVDCSSSYYYLDKPTIRRLFDTYGEDRVLFGTDYPMWSPKAELETLFSLGLGDEALEKILSLNAKKVFSID